MCMTKQYMSCRNNLKLADNRDEKPTLKSQLTPSTPLQDSVVPYRATYFGFITDRAAIRPQR